MNATKLSAYLEEFLTLKRTMAEGGPHYGRVDRNRLNHRQRLLRAIFAFWQKQGCPWPVRAQFALLRNSLLSQFKGDELESKRFRLGTQFGLLAFLITQLVSGKSAVVEFLSGGH